MAHRLTISLCCLALVLAPALAKVPDYISICGRRNPQLDKCVEESAIKLVPKLKAGIPELDVPSLEPLTVDEVALANIKDFNAVATNVELLGLSDFVIKYLKVDLENKKISIELNFPKVYMNADYDVKAKIIVPIKEKGPINTVTDNVAAKVLMQFQTIERRGRKYLYFDAMTTKLKISDYRANFMPGAAGQDNPLAQAINSVLLNSRQEIIASMTPNLEKAVSERVIYIANQICKHFTYDELFPDRV